jgi:uncharacterized membrane protein YgcG
MKLSLAYKVLPVGLLSLLLPTLLLAASTAATEASKFVGKFNTIILFPTIALLSAVALLVFLWGVAEYFMNATSDQGREQGVKHITWGIIGLVVMLSAYAILSIAASTIGFGKQLDCASDPNGAGCAGVFSIPASGGSGGSGSGGSGGSGSGGSGGSGSGSNP